MTRDAAREPGQERGFLHGRVAAADHRDVLVAEEEPVTGGAGAHAHADQGLLAGHAEVAGRGAHREDDGTGPVGLVTHGDRLDRPVQRHRVDVFHAQVGAEPQGLLAHLVHQFRAGDAVAEAGVVLHLGGGHQRAAELGALEHQGRQLRAGRVDRRGISGRTGADDDHVMDGGCGGHAALSACSVAGSRVSLRHGYKHQGRPGCSQPGGDYGRLTTVSASSPVSAELQSASTTRATSALGVSPGSTISTAGRPCMSTGRAPSTLVAAG